MHTWAEALLGGVGRLFEIGLNRSFYDFTVLGGGSLMFLKVLYRSMVAGGTVLAILPLRMLLKRAPKVCSYLLWALVLYRLLCPFTFVSSLSLLGMFETEDAAQIQMVETEFSEVQMESGAGETPDIQTEGQTPGISREEGRNRRSRLRMAAHVWAAGIAAMLLYGAVSMTLLSRRLKGAVRLRGNIYLSDYVPTPFVIGLIRPRIFLPSSLQETEMDYIILHERTHIRRGDHIIRMISFFTLAVYWFHPLVWAAYYLSGKDMEMSCDEAVMRKMGQDIRADYSTSLLNLAAGRIFPGGTPLAFGEGDTKTRIKNVMRWRRPKPVVTGIALAAVVVAAVVLGTDPKAAEAGNGGLRQSMGAENAELRQAAETWAKAYCDRDGATIVNLSTPQVQETLIEEELLSGEAGDYGFGWSSPWPWNSDTDYRIVSCTENQTVIQYYAWTSDPHVTVWQELLVWEQENGEYRVKENSASWIYDSISGSSGFAEAYGAGINGTPIDYLTNGAGEALNENALQNREYYQDLFAPETAARFLLNLSADESAVTVSAGSRQDDGSVEVTVSFPADGGSAVMKMVQPYGEDGIWIAQDAGYLFFQF
ncbi:MAG: M56 family metallopeptidase [Lachnospiraceae bacterium]|nr:M56 family metallopeptidase [Lachnospiraceae bacterium]